MLGIHGVRHDAAGYYLADLAPELPEARPGRWSGALCADWGLDGLLAAPDFEQLLEGRRPGTDRPLGTGRTTVAAYDLTFSAPKSASVLFALGTPEVARRVVAAHEEAVAGALSYLERHALSATRREGIVPTTGMAAARFTHGISRNGDPHVHTHVVMANLVHGADGRWGACDRRGLDAHRRAGGGVYEAHLRASLGVRWSRHAAEVDGVPPPLIGEFSSRAADIRLAGGSRRVAWASTRPAKELALPYEELAGQWRRRARAAAGEVPEPQRAPLPRVLDEHRVAGALSHTPHGGAHRRDVVAAMATGASDGVRAGALERLVEVWAPASAVGVAEPLLTRRSALPANHHLRALGPRPLDPADHAVWVGAARALDAYRVRWGLERSAEPLGSVVPSRLPAGHLADRVRTARQIDMARARLGRRAPHELGLGLGR